MAMTPQDRSKPLHNFSLPCLKWGNQRHLRCVKVTDRHHHGASSSAMIPNGFQANPLNLDTSKNHEPNPGVLVNQASPAPGFNGGAKRLKVASSHLEEERGKDGSPRPWNLRTRRSACKAPLGIEEKRNNIDSPRRNLLEMDSPKRNIESSLDKRHNMEMAMTMKEKIKFSVSLTKEEIEEDFMDMARIRPPRRPKKRPRIVQKYLDSIFPGLWLSEVSADSYKVPELPES